ncbi:hypothetical protein [Croceicoccus naphthovorans]|uniref:Uncharacterized protein n=1 Tax=Croceicoccus naphthovorans TaxID=1348774 RepID=A0A0G3XF19_9SPHN|nr:hypothetical protein [Croceicoccus naphthovorans]AKM10105.1 hypothetical protein AB433_09170 [Croceicoccus naphthovorans]MBB3991160.1 hypothetical protein [Croceicoccus naphthovorans]
MHYMLVFDGKDGEPGKAIEFDAQDAAGALIHAHREAPDRSATLWEGERELCKIRRTENAGVELWQVLPLD